jgi:hypothetical protein
VAEEFRTMRSSRDRAKKLSILAALLTSVAACAQTDVAPTARPETPQVTAAPRPPQPVTTTPVTRPPTTRPGTTPPAAGAIDPKVDEILTRLEQRQVRDLKANIAWLQQYVRDDPKDWITKHGAIIYVDAKPVAKFLIHFEKQVVGDRADKLDERHAFDGLWYVKIDGRTKTCERREIRKANDPGNPYKVGQGVFPMPFGQKKDDVLGEFAVQLVRPDPNDPEETDHLHLVPHAGTRSADAYKELDFWIRRGGALDGLPIKVRVTKMAAGKTDSYITITFRDVELNTGVSMAVVAPECPKGYQETVETLEPTGGDKVIK